MINLAVEETSNDLKPTKNTLKKIEYLFERLGYEIRYAKGTFQSGYCIIHEQKVAVINKFYDTEGRVNTLLDILSKLEIDKEGLDASCLKLISEFERQYRPAEMELTK